MHPRCCATVLSLLASTTALPAAAQAAATTQEATPAGLHEFRRMNWLVGRWRGTGGGAFASFPAFYEEYVLRDDSTVVLRTFADSTFQGVADSTLIALRGGRVSSQPARGTTVPVMRVTEDSIVFRSDPETLYLRIADDHWRASFATPAGLPPRYFDMRRVNDPERHPVQSASVARASGKRLVSQSVECENQLSVR